MLIYKLNATPINTPREFHSLKLNQVISEAFRKNKHALIPKNITKSKWSGNLLVQVFIGHDHRDDMATALLEGWTWSSQEIHLCK